MEGHAGRRAEKMRVHWEGMFRGTGHTVEGEDEGRKTIRFGTYNIRSRWNSELESELRGMGKSNMDVRVFQETKLTEGIYMRKSARYKIVASTAPSRHCGGATLFYWDYPNFAGEAICQFGANVIAC